MRTILVGTIYTSMYPAWVKRGIILPATFFGIDVEDECVVGELGMYVSVENIVVAF
jgi:hypothetical protein